MQTFETEIAGAIELLPECAKAKGRKKNQIARAQNGRRNRDSPPVVPPRRRYNASVNRGEYCISKAGIAMATKLWATRLGEFDIPVYEIQPGVIRSDMTLGVTEKYDQLFKNGLAIQQRWGLPEDVGKVAAAMASGSMPYSTGQVVLVDGGMSVQRL